MKLTQTLILIGLTLLTPIAYGKLLKQDKGGLIFNFTPALVDSEGSKYKIGYGVDPELRYGGAIGFMQLSLGFRYGAYRAKDISGDMTMPTLRMTIPISKTDFYVAGGVGCGRIPRLDYRSTSTMIRAGLQFPLSERTSLNIEATRQGIKDSDFIFTSYGSAIAFGF